ncbi:Histone-lysine N-methyltransferase ASHH2 [Camellia lanceoleosa]|uniref:Histone-lysine N-methyltransferase ASHH2 n=1 Tax=Camellia lanceoleosa TaxID=1840588 RepID=A0ACC0HNC6_9ERIC|nr:Histone-lysine N-methyltransferase ASHH2 [Camellia lanceoleosa]
MLIEILPVVASASSFKGGSSNMDPNCALEELSVSLRSCEPFSVTDNEPCKSLVAPCISGTEVLVGALNSFSIVESSEHRDDKGKDKVKFDDAFEMKCPDTICSSPPRRSSQRTKLNEKTQTRKGGRKCGRTVMRKPLLDSVPFGVARKRRNFCKPARSSVWGSLSYISQIFEQNTGVDVNQNEHTKSRNARGVQGIGKHSKNQVGASSQRSKRKKIATSGRIRLKVTLRKEVGQSFLPNMVSITGNGLGNDWGTNSEVPKLTDGSENKLKEEGPRINGFQCCNGDLEKAVSNTSHLNVCLANKDLESPVIYENSDGITADNHQSLPSEIEVEGLGVAFDNRYLDSGTSPDSEVINLITETQVNGKVQEDLKDALISSQACCVAPEDFTSLDLSRMRNKKGKKKDKLFHAGNFSVGDRLPSQEILNKASVLEKWGQGEKMGDGSYSSEASISTATANVSGNTSSSEGVSREPLPSSRITDFGVSCENLKAESGTEEDICFRLGVGLESPESHISENLLPNSKAKGWKHFKSSKPRGMSKSGSEVCDSPRSQSGNACGQKGNPVKSVSRKKVKDKGASNEVVSKVENHQETGDHSLDNPGKPKTCDEIITKDIFNLSMVPRDAGKHGLMPRSAWVCCDDCLKWRRILANLADSIEETNCRWTCMDNIDKGFADCSIPQEKSNAEINAELEISDEEDAYDALYSKRLEPKHSTVQEQSSWMLIKSNLFLHRSRKSQTIDEIMVCHCKPRPDGRMMGCGDGCLNRMLNIECVKGTCPCGQRCSNQQFQKRKYAKLRWFRCGMKGYGLQLLEDISEGQFLIEYVGEVLDMQAYEARQREYAATGHKHFYFMTLNGSEWMVNGEVCIGLFALKDIKKGEEVTFDYNFVRVFGAAAKKCVCGSSQCRGYIGGDPLNTEVVVQCDPDEEYPEPVMVYRNGKPDHKLKKLLSSTSSSESTEVQITDHTIGNKDKMDKSATAVGHLEITTELQTAEILVKDETDKSATAVQHLEIPTRKSLNKCASGECLQISLAMDNSVEKLPPSVQQVVTSSQLDDMMGKTISNAKQEFVQRLETSALIVISNKSLSNTIDAKKKCNSDIIEDRCASKSYPLMKTSRLSSSVKKGKLNSNSVNVHKPDMMVNKSPVLPYKPKRIMEGSLNGRLEYVEETLNGLLDADGGISKRKDASKGYLMLLLQTATSGDSGNGEAIQSNRDLSMILDGLLKTKSRMVLVDIINTNGLQMLHNIMKQYRRDFNKIPILRKLLKVLEYLAVREILTLEHITGGPRYPGVESFRESILILTEHDDKQVHQIARNFRDRWIPRSARHISCLDRSNGKVEFHRGSNCNRHSASQRDQGVKTIEAINCINQSIVATNSVNTSTLESCSAPSGSDLQTSGTKTRKRKSRWDQPAEIKTYIRSPQKKEPKIEPSLLQQSHSGPPLEIGKVACDGPQQMENRGDDEEQNIDEDVDVPPGFSPLADVPPGFSPLLDVPPGFSPLLDVPPGFSPHNAPSVPSNALTVTDILRENGTPAKCPFEAVAGHPHGKFGNRLPVSYGIALPLVQQFGTPQSEKTLESWVIAPGMAFCPFPPLPPRPQAKREPCAGDTVTKNKPTICHSNQNHPSTSGVSRPYVEFQGGNIQHSVQPVRSSYGLERRYPRQQEWNNSNLEQPWMWNRNGGQFMGNNLRNGMYSIGVATVANGFEGPKFLQDLRTGVQNTYNTFHLYPQQQN